MPKIRELPSAEILNEWFLYQDGVLFWRKKPSKNIMAGARSGKSQKPLGYVQIGLNGQIYFGHRIVWKMHYGIEPTAMIDHIDGDRSNNRIENLRLASNSENMTNRSKTKRNKTGFKGVCFNRRLNKYQSNICKNYKLYYLGLFETAEEAHAAYLIAANKLHGNFSKG